MNYADTQAREFEAFGRYIEGGTARSLDLLRAIEQTVTAVDTIGGEMAGYTTLTHKLIDGVAALQRQVPEAETLGVFADAQDGLERLHGRLMDKLAHAECAPELRDDDGVCESYRTAIGAVNDLHESIECFRWTLMQSNAAYDTSDAGPTLSTPEAIDAALAAL